MTIKKTKTTETSNIVSGNEQQTNQSGNDFGSNSDNNVELETNSEGRVESPTSEEAVLAAARAACPMVADLESRDKQADERLLEYVEAFEAMEPGNWTAEAQELWVAFLAAAKDVAIETGDTSGKDVRTLYDGPFTDMMNQWIAANEAAEMDLEEQAVLAHMYRKTLRELSRDLMVDTNSVKVLRARDMVKHGSPWGPSFKTLFDKNKKETGSDEGAYRAIIGSSTSHDKAASKSAKGGGGSGGGGSGAFIKSKL